MKPEKILNPYRELPGYRCFGCSPDNPAGLRMEFQDEGEYIVSHWDPRPEFQGYLNVLHGGIQATLLDEIASWVVMVHLKTGGVTARMETRYLKRVMVDEGPIRIRARLLEHHHRLANIQAELFNASGELACEATVQYFLMPEKMAREKLAYPGAEQFKESTKK